MARPLSKALREQIEDSVIAATHIPAKKKAVIASTKAAVREALRLRLPEGFEAATAHLPPEWFDGTDLTYIADAVNPESILYYSRDASNMVRYHGGSSHYLGFETLHHPRSKAPWLRSQHDPEQPVEPTWDRVLAAQITEAEKLHKKECEMRAELRAVLHSVNSVEKLIEKMPSLARHVPPAPGKAMPLVVSTAKAESLLKKAGFDTGAAAA